MENIETETIKEKTFASFDFLLLQQKHLASFLGGKVTRWAFRRDSKFKAREGSQAKVIFS